MSEDSSQLLKEQALQMAQGQSSDFHIQWVSKLIQSQGFNQDGFILDFGAGKGTLLQSLQTLGIINLWGADLLSDPSGGRFEWRKEDLNSFPFESLKNKFDWILCIEVIEHLENPRQILRGISEMLKPGGKLLLTTPNVESYRSLLSFIFRGHFIDFLDSSYPAHITPMVLMDMKRILQECGLELFHLEYSGRGTLPVWTSLSWQKISMDLLSGKRFSDHVMLVVRKNS